MVSSYEYYFPDEDGNDHSDDHYAFHENDDRSSHHPQHVATPHGAMTEILAATGSTSPPSPRKIKKQEHQLTKQNNRPSSNPETVAKKALRLKAAKHFHRAGSSSSSAGGAVGNNNSSASTTRAQSKEVQAPSKVAAVRSSNKYYYPEECSSTVPAVNGQEFNTHDDGKNKPASPTPSPNRDINQFNLVEDDPAIEIYEEDSASEIGSGYNSGSDLENAARKILRRRGVGSSSRTTSSSSSFKPNYNSDDNASDTGSAVSTASSSFRKLPDGWKERIKRKAGMPKLPPTMDKKEKLPASSSSNAIQQRQQPPPPPPSIQETGNDDDQNYRDSAGGDQYYNLFSAVAGVYEDIDDDDDEYYQDHFNGNSNGAFPSFSNHNNYDDAVDNVVGHHDDNPSSILNHPPIYEEHIFGPIQPLTIYESNDEYEQDDNDGPLFKEEGNADDLTLLKDDDNRFVPIREVDESGFPSPSRKTNTELNKSALPSPSRKTNTREEVDESGFPAPSRKNKAQNSQEQLEHQDRGNDLFPLPPGVKWKTSSKRGTAAPPPVTDHDILATFSNDKEDTTVPSFAWSDSSFRDNVGASASPQCGTFTEEGKEGNEKVSPAMQPFSDGDLSDPDNDTSDVDAAVATTSLSKRRLNFFKRRGRRYHSEGERSDSEHDTETSKTSPLRRKNKLRKNTPKKNEAKRKLFGNTPKKSEKRGPPAHVKNAVSAPSPAITSETSSKPSSRNAVTPIVSNKMTTDDLKPLSSVNVTENDATDDKSVSTLGSILTRETSSKARVASSNASANTAMSEIERLRKENDKLRQELERQAVRRENKRLRQELEKRAANEATSPHRPRHTDSAGESGDESFSVKKNPRNGMHRSTLTSLLESDVKASQRNRRHRVTKNHLMNQADFDDESITTYSPIRPNKCTTETTGPELLTKVAGATGWVASQVRNAAQDHGHRPLECFAACTRKDRGQRRRRRNGSKGTHDDNESDTDSLEDYSLTRTGGRPRPPIARRKATANRGERMLI